MASIKTDEETTRPDDRIERVIVKSRQRPTLQVPQSELQPQPVSSPSVSSRGVDSDSLPIEPDDTLCDASDHIIEHDFTINEPEVSIDEPDISISEPDVTINDPTSEDIQPNEDETDLPSQKDNILGDAFENSHDSNKPKENSDISKDDSNSDLISSESGVPNEFNNAATVSPNDQLRHKDDDDGKSKSSLNAPHPVSGDDTKNKQNGDGLGSKNPNSWVTFDERPSGISDGLHQAEDDGHQRGALPNNSDPKFNNGTNNIPQSSDPLESSNQPTNQVPVNSNQPNRITRNSPESRLNAKLPGGSNNTNDNKDSKTKGPLNKDNDHEGLHDSTAPAVIVAQPGRYDVSSEPRESLGDVEGLSGTEGAAGRSGGDGFDLNRSRASSRTSLADTDSLLPKHGQWSTRLCQCDNGCGEVCYSGACLPCATYQLASNMGQTDAHGPLCCLQCYLGDLRTRLRHMHGISGNDDTDCCISYWCSSCAIAQMRREMRIRGNQ